MSAKCQVPSARTQVSSHGFTLLEVLVASAILSIVLAALYGVFSHTLASKRLAEERAARARVARIVLLRIGEDLQSAIPPTTGNARFKSETRVSRNFSDDTLSFVTITRTASSGLAPEGELSEIEYLLEPDPTNMSQKQLVRRVRFVLSPQGNAAEESAPLLPDVQGLRFRFFDGRTWREDWQQEQGQNQLPQAVEAAVYLTDSRGESAEFSTIFTLPLAGKKRNKFS